MNRFKRLEMIMSQKSAANTSSAQKAAEMENQPSSEKEPTSATVTGELTDRSTADKGTSNEPRLPKNDEDIVEFDRWNPMSEDYLSPMNTLTVSSSSDPLTMITGKIQPIPSKIGNITICERFAKYGECADGRFCSRIHIDPRARQKIWAIQNTYELNKGRTCMNYTYLSPIDIRPDPDALLLVSIASISSPSNFYAVAPFENLNFINLSRSDMDFHISRVHQTSTAKKKIEQFHLQMADIFGHSYRVDNLNDDIYLSQVVACKLKDGFFRRATVVGLPDPADYADVKFKLFLIDVGVEVELPRELIYDIRAIILSEPPLALNCRLNIKPARGALEWSTGAQVQFNNLVKQNRFSLCRVKDHIEADRILTVDLLDINTKLSFTDKMLSSGLAVKCGP